MLMIGWPRGQRGSLSVELVVLAPGLVLLLLLLAAGARVVEVQGHIDGAARDAARAASIARSPAQAWTFARQAAQGDLGATSWCTRVSVPRPQGFPGGTGVLLPPGSHVTVTVTCEVDMSPFKVLGYGASTSFSGTAVAPLDPFMCRDTTC
jgi:TadE-like protein